MVGVHGVARLVRGCAARADAWVDLCGCVGACVRLLLVHQCVDFLDDGHLNNPGRTVRQRHAQQHHVYMTAQRYNYIPHTHTTYTHSHTHIHTDAHLHIAL